MHPDIAPATATRLPLVWAQARSTDFPQPPPTDALAILPIGSTEQHGPHLPVEVDSLLVEAVALGGAALAQNRGLQVQVLPTLWVSLAEHHMGMGGSLTLDFPTLLAFVRCIVQSLQRQGFRRVLPRHS